jgi:glutaredoxin-related protein
LRDRHPAFDNAKANGYIGIPALLLEGDKVVLDLAELEGIFG